MTEGQESEQRENLTEEEKHQEYIEANQEAERIWAEIQGVFDEHRDDPSKAEKIVLEQYADQYDKALEKDSEKWEAWRDAMREAHKEESV